MDTLTANRRIAESNKAIAEFMEVAKCDRHKDGECGHYKFGAGIYYWPQEMKYHTSWDWLKPVIHKIGDTALAENLISTEAFQRLWRKTILDDINVVYHAVSSFIDWYTSNKKK